MAITLTLNDVFLRAGPARRTFLLAEQVRPARPWDRLTRYGLLIHWPRTAGWLSLSAEVVPASGPVRRFAATPGELDGVAVAHRVDRDQVASAKFLDARHALAATLDGPDRVSLTVTVDTDAAGFRAAVEAGRNPATRAVVIPVGALLFDAAQFNTFVTQTREVEVVLTPCLPLPRYGGAVAIDLGNTVTTAAALSEDKAVYRSDAVDLIPLDPGVAGHDQALLASVVRVDRVDTPNDAGGGPRRVPGQPSDDRRAAVVYVTGERAAGAGELTGGLVFGAKQRLTTADSPTSDRVIRLTVTHRRGPAEAVEEVEVLERLPGELVFADVVGRVREGVRGWPADLVLTYPTTYTRRELAQLARAAARGWLRAADQPQSPAGLTPADRTGDPEFDGLADRIREWLDGPSDPDHCPLFGQLVDEATAAAFFHIHREAFEQPGGVKRFRYLYPDGCRVLVIDCGGGTTDVVLVRAAVGPDTDRPGRPVLDLDVLARTGLRGFGGDHITRAVARLVKAKMTVAIARAADPGRVPGGLTPTLIAPPNPVNARKEVEAFLTRATALAPAGQPDGYVPTRYDPADLTADGLRRRAAARGLWLLAEELKRKLSDPAAHGKPVRLKELAPVHLLKSSPLVASAVGRCAQPDAVLAQLAEVAVSGWEVDALVGDTIRAVMAKCNRLIDAKLRPAAGPDEEVDQVVLSGNGSRYPLVRRLAEAELHVGYLADPGSPGRLVFDPDNLKHAVAKGAVLARSVARVPRTAGVRYRRDLSRLLPFDVGAHDFATNTTTRLFREFTAYHDLPVAAAVVEVHEESRADRTGEPVAFRLERRFPGDDGWSAFARYDFPDGLRGPVTVRYDPDMDHFRVTDADGREGAYTDLTDPAGSSPSASLGDI